MLHVIPYMYVCVFLLCELISLTPAGGSLEGLWGNPCPHCGNGRGYILDTLHQSPAQLCQCQRGSLVIPDLSLDERPPSVCSRPTTATLRLTTASARPPSTASRHFTSTPRPPSTMPHPQSTTPRPQSTTPRPQSTTPRNDVSTPVPQRTMSSQQLELDMDMDDPIPRAVNFISNALGQLVTLTDTEDIQGAVRPSRVGFSQGKTRPNVNRQRRENRALYKASEEMRAPGPMPAVLTNARR